jgi:hypothetical protein
MLAIPVVTNGTSSYSSSSSLNIQDRYSETAFFNDPLSFPSPSQIDFPDLSDNTTYF